MLETGEWSEWKFWFTAQNMLVALTLYITWISLLTCSCDSYTVTLI